MREPGERGPAIPGGKAGARLRQIRRELGIQVAALPPPAWSQYAVSEERARLLAARPANEQEPSWSFLGPDLISGNAARDQVPAAGRISAIAIDPTNPEHLLIGAAAGGIWERLDAESAWLPRTDDQRTLTIGALAFDTGEPRTVYAGTGEGNSFSDQGTGVLRSVDGGKTWKEIPARTFDGQGFYDLLVIPEDTLLAATTAGLYRSANAGKTWTCIRCVVTWDLSLGSGTCSGELLAAGADGLQRSMDGGKCWEAVDLPNAPAALDRMAVCHAPADGGVAYVFAAATEEIRRISKYDGPFLWRRDGPGKAFTKITPPLGLETVQAWYDWLVVVAPARPGIPETVFLGAASLFKGVRLPSGAFQWKNISTHDGRSAIHADQHVLVFSADDPTVLYVGNDGGIYGSEDGGETWNSLNAGLGITEIEYLAQHPSNPNWLLAGTQDNGTLRYQGLPQWTQVARGDGGECGADEVLSHLGFHSFYEMGIERSSHGADPGSWTPIGPATPAGYRSLFYPPMEVRSGVLAQAGTSVWISSDTGDTWTEVELPDGAGLASALAIASSDSILVGTDSGDLLRLERFGGSWQVSSVLVQPRAGFISSVLVDPRSELRIWVTYTDAPTPDAGQIFFSDDGGRAWKDFSVSKVVPVPTYVVEIDPTQPDTIYAGTQAGVFRHQDGVWTLFGKGLPNATVGDLVFHVPSRLLRAGTRSRGVWEIAISE